MRMRVWLTVLAVALGAGAVGIAAQGQSTGQNSGQSPSPDSKMEMGKPAPAAGPLKIAFGDKSVEWTAATLAALPHKTLTLYNEHAKANQTYSGVELIDLLKPLGVPEKPHGKDFRLYLVAEGSDGPMAIRWSTRWARLRPMSTTEPRSLLTQWTENRLAQPDHCNL